jgi:two-component system cell cycle sensor histidine kinase/response regulator CckA
VKSPSQTASVDDQHVREVAHDFNNLLTAIISAAEAVLRRPEIDPESRADIENLREGARRGAVLIRRLQPGGDDPSAKPGLTSINETIRATSRLLAHRLGAHIELTLELEQPDSKVWAEPAQLDRVLLNLIANARHAIASSGAVTLRTMRRTVDVAEQRVPDLVPPGDYLVIAVADTGKGMLRDELLCIFDPRRGSRPDTGGSGLGLSSIREIVRRCNGFLAVDSIKGHGTRVEIFLPRDYDARRHHRIPETFLPDVGRAVLLVDDDLLVRQVLERIMQRAGWTVRSADSGQSALNALKEARFDLMISDVRMCGMDGLLLTRLALEHQPDLAVILTSGYAFAASDLAPAAANVTFLPKPYGQGELLAAVSHSMGKQAADSTPKT